MTTDKRPEVAIGQAPGKLILFGEHSIAYGQPAVGVPLSRGVKVTLRRGSGQVHASLGPGIDGPAPVVPPEALVQAALGPSACELDVTIEIGLPPSAGLGTSAALAIALLRARATLEDLPLSAAVLLERATAVENVAHGRSSGLDPALCLHTGVIELLRHEGSAPELHVRAQAPISSFHLVVGVRGSHGGTGVRVREVAQLHAAIPVAVDAAMLALGAAARVGGAALVEGDLGRAGAAANLAHGVLAGLGLVADETESLVRTARRAGALGAKMTGAGGGGGAFYALAADWSAALAIQHALEAAGARAWIETAGDVGISGT